MYKKALLFDDKDVAVKILRSSDAKRHRYLGREVKSFDKKIWQSKCLQYAIEGNVAKFKQNIELLNELKKTVGKHFAEASAYDRNWGIGLSLSNPKTLDRSQWRGKNWAGKALESAREIIFNSMSLS